MTLVLVSGKHQIQIFQLVLSRTKFLKEAPRIGVPVYLIWNKKITVYAMDDLVSYVIWFYKVVGSQLEKVPKFKLDMIFTSLIFVSLLGKRII